METTPIPKHIMEALGIKPYNEDQMLIDACGGWDGYYKKIEHEKLWLLQEEIKEPELSPHVVHESHAEMQQEIDRITVLFSVYELLQKSGKEVSFMGLTHASELYWNTVLKQMEQLLLQGKADEAIAIYKVQRFVGR